MVCRDCGKSPSRHEVVKMNSKVSGDIDVEKAAPVAPAPPSGPQDPYSVFEAARKLSYDELEQRRTQQGDMMKAQSEIALGQMSDAMRRVHVEELLRVINYENMAPQGITPGQAVMALKQSFDRPEFAFLEEVYPGVKEAVDERYNKLMNNRIPVRLKE